MSTDIGDVLQKAIENKKNDINSFVWKTQNGEEQRLLDLIPEDLQTAYDHTTDMLWNTSLFRPGKYEIRKNIQMAFNNCNAELFLRYLLHECEISSLRTNKDILDFISSNRKVNKTELTDYVTSLFLNLPPVFEKVTVDKLMSACFDKLDVLNRKMISDKFIISQGIWLTGQEKNELLERDENGKVRNRMDVIKERLFLNSDVRLRVDPNGLTYTEFRSLVTMDSVPKISSLPTTTLKVLRDKILLLLDNDLEYHIEKWSNIKEQIEKVAEYRKINLINKYV